MSARRPTRGWRKPAFALLLSGALGGGFASVAVAPSRSANACDGVIDIVDVTAATAADITYVSGTIVSQLMALEAALIKALELNAGQIHGGHAVASRTIGDLTDAANMNRALLAKQKASMKAHAEYITHDTYCEAVSGIRGMAATEGEGGFIQRKADNQMLDFSNKAAAGPPGKNVDERSPLGSQLQAADYRFGMLMGKYCDEKELEGLTASERQRIGCKQPSKPELINADIKAMTLMDNATMDQDRFSAAQQFVVHLVDPMPVDPIPPAALNTIEGKQAYIMRKASQANLQVATQALHSILKSRAPTTKRKAWADELLREIYPDGKASRLPSGEGLSERQLDDILFSRRFQNPRYYTKLQAANIAALLREQVVLDSFALMLDWKNYQLMEQLVTIRAAALAMEVRKDRGQASVASMTRAGDPQ